MRGDGMYRDLAATVHADAWCGVADYATAAEKHSRLAATSRSTASPPP